MTAWKMHVYSVHAHHDEHASSLLAGHNTKVQAFSDVQHVDACLSDMVSGCCALRRRPARTSASTTWWLDQQTGTLQVRLNQAPLAMIMLALRTPTMMLLLILPLIHGWEAGPGSAQTMACAISCSLTCMLPAFLCRHGCWQQACTHQSCSSAGHAHKPLPAQHLHQVDIQHR